VSGLGGRSLVRVMVAVACCLTAAVSALASTASAASPALNVAPETLVVASGGSDACAPCATISQAVARGSADLKAGAASAVMIIVAAGRYDENVSISTGPITISGAGAGVTLVNGGYSGSVFTVAKGATVTITDLAIAFGSADNGGGVDNAGNLTLQRDSVTGNAANMSGGGIYNTGTLEVDDSTISAGQAHILGGGIASDIGSTATLVRDAITRNTVFGSGIYGAGGAGIGEYGATLSVRDSTITDNVLKNTGVGGGITAIFGFSPTTLVGDTIAFNQAPSGGGLALPTSVGLAFPTINNFGVSAGTIIAGNQGGDCLNPVGSSEGYNLDDDGSCFGSGPGDQVRVDPRLGPLGDNGGPTQTLAISSASPAYDAATPVATRDGFLCAGTDQRGISRLQRGATRCDIGAFQVAAPTLYVANPGANSVTAYAPGADGDTPPVLTLTGSLTGLSNPNGIAVDVAGDVFVANTNANSVTKYAPELTGDAAPVATIAGPLTRLDNPRGLTRDAAGHLFVANVNAVTEYAASANGNVAPIARIAGTRTRLSLPLGLAIGPHGNLRVANDNGKITSYAAGANGNVAPVAVLTDHLTSPQALTFDSAGRLLVSDAATNTVKAFAAGATGTSGPLSTLTATNPPLSVPIGVDVDDADDLFVANAQTNAVTEFAPGAAGAASPLAVIAGPDTGLHVPTFLAELPPGPYPNVLVRRLGRRSLARILRAGLSVSIQARGRLAFRSAPLRVTAALRVRQVTIATGRVTITGPGSTTLTLLPVRRVPRRIRRAPSQQAVVIVTFRHGSEVRRRRLPVRLTR
jgi:NHL repeat